MTKQPHAIRVRPDYPQPSAATFQRACFAAFIRASGYNLGFQGKSAEDVCRSLFPGDEAAPLLYRSAQEKAAVTVADTASGWASEIADRTSLAFLRELAPDSAAARMIARGLSFPIEGNGTVLMPKRASGPMDMPWVGEGQPIPLRGDAITGVKLDAPKKLGIIVGFTRETAQRAQAQAVFDAVLRESAANALDSAYFGTQAASATAYAGLLNGLTASTLVDGNDPRRDLAALAKAVSAGGSGSICFVTGPGRAAQLGVLLPELKADIFGTVAVSDNRIIGVDPRSFVHGVGAVPEIRASREAALHMNDEAAEIVSGTGPATAAPVANIWQIDAIALRALIDITYVARRAGAVAFFDNPVW